MVAAVAAAVEEVGAEEGVAVAAAGSEHSAYR